MDNKRLRTPQEVREEFSRKGISVAGWARQYGLNPSVVRSVLSGGRKCLFGQSHKAAVLLGLKEGEIIEEQGHDSV